MLRYYGRLVVAFFVAAFRRTDLVLTAIAAVSLAALIFFSPEIATDVLNLEWGALPRWWALIPIALLVAYDMLRLNYETWRFERVRADTAEAKIASLMTPMLDLIYDANDPACHQRDLWDPPEQPKECYIELYRVGIVNRSNVSVEGVVVRLRHFKPQGAVFLPVQLHQMHDRTTGEVISTQGTRIDPGGPTIYATVAFMRYTAGPFGWPPSTEIFFDYAGMPDGPVPPQDYILTLEVQGKNVPATQRQFSVWVAQGQLQFAAFSPDAR